MKVRSDFISNSSSSSFIVSCQKQYLDAIIKDIAKACVCKKSRYHNKMLEARNKRILDFCLKTYQLIFIGDLVIETRKKIYNLDYFLDLYGKDKDESARNMWDKYKRYLYQAKNDPMCKSWIKDLYLQDEYDPDKDEAIHYEKTSVSGIVASNFSMEYEFDHYHFSVDTPDIIRNRVAKLIEVAKRNAEDYNSNLLGPVDIYQITKDTITNTRNLIDAEYEVKLDDWENLDELESKIDNGDVIFYIRIARDGDGYGDFYIYEETGADGLNGISGIEILTSCCE